MSQDFDGEKEAGESWTNPPLMIGRQPAGGHDAMYVRMPDQRLSPRVENAEDTDLGPEVAGVRGDFS